MKLKCQPGDAFLYLHQLLSLYSLYKPHFERSKKLYARVCLCFALLLLDIFITSAIPNILKMFVQTIESQQYVMTFLAVYVLFWTLDHLMPHLLDYLFFPITNKVIASLTFQMTLQIQQIHFQEKQGMELRNLLGKIRRLGQSTRTLSRIVFFEFVPSAAKVFLLGAQIIHHLSYFSLLVIAQGCFLSWCFFKLSSHYLHKRQLAWLQSDLVLAKIGECLDCWSWSSKIAHQKRVALRSHLDAEETLWLQTNNSMQEMNITLVLLQATILASVLFGSIYFHDTPGSMELAKFLAIKTATIYFLLKLICCLNLFKRIGESYVDISYFLIKPVDRQGSQYQQGILINTIEEITVRDLSYSRESGPILTKISLKIVAGDKIFIYGANGVGKSSLLKLIMGFYNPSSGAILVNGEHLEHIDLASYYNKVCYLNNNDETMIQNSSLDAFNVVTSKSIRQSDGQKQLDLIQHALAMNPEVLIIDETLNYLTKNKQQEILKIIFQKVKTVIVVSHQLELKKYFDRVYALTSKSLKLVTSIKNQNEKI